MSEKTFTRRRFLAGAMASGALLSQACGRTFSIVPRHVLGGAGFVAPSERVNIAKVGCGGMGHADLNGVQDNPNVNIVGLCDVDWERAAGAFNRHPSVAHYRDYRLMLDELGDTIDAVMISTPDHTHAQVAMAAMRRGKHIFVQKPMAHNIAEVRMMTQAARKYGVASHMGIQGHAGEGWRLMWEWIVKHNAIGKVREVKIWTDRPIWPQDVDRPAESVAVPDTLNWDLWLGPASWRPYNPIYAPFKWRGWYDFGTGALGDMGCHMFDAPFSVLNLGYPTSVEAECSPLRTETYPAWSRITYEFPERGEMPPVTLTWYDGKKKPEMPPELEEGRNLGGNTQIFIGDEGVITCGPNGQSPRIIPEKRMKEFAKTKPEKVLDRSIGHYEEWIEACKGGKPAGANFDYSGPMTEVVHLGNLALRTGHRIEFDPKALKVTNCDYANKFIGRDYRQGWEL